MKKTKLLIAVVCLSLLMVPVAVAGDIQTPGRPAPAPVVKPVVVDVVLHVMRTLSLL